MTTFEIKSPHVDRVKDMFVVRGRVTGGYNETLGVFPFDGDDDESRNRARYLSHAFVELIHELEIPLQK